MALEDIAFFRNIPNGVVLVPGDGVSAEKAVQLVGNYNDGPAFIRTSRPDVPLIYENDEEFELGKCNSIIYVGKMVKSSEEDQIVIFTYGVILHESLKAYEQLSKEGINLRIIDLFSLKPFDAEAVRYHVQECKGVVLVAE